MQAAMTFMKNHWISLLAGVLALAFIAVGVLGMTSKAVTTKLEERLKQRQATQLTSLARDPKNQAIIDAEKARGEAFQREYEQTLKQAYEINAREPIMAGVFPIPENRIVTPVQFKEQYAQAMKRLPTRLNAGTLPTELEIADEEQNIADLLALERERQIEGGAQAKSITEQSPQMTGRGARFAGSGDDEGPLGMGGAAPMMPGGRGGMSRGMMQDPMGGMSNVDRQEPKYNPVFRANVTKAKTIRCYIDPTTFHMSPIVNMGSPTEDQMWLAQMGYWVQEDMVEAIRKVNEAAASDITETDVYVEQMPVKRIEAVRVLEYRGDKGTLPFPGADDAGGSGGGIKTDLTLGGPSFTGRLSNEDFDVIRVAVAVVMDQRDVLKLVDQVCKQNFYQCVNLRYQQVTPEDRALGYMYGTEPVVRVVMEFEGYFARAVYKPLMPPAILQLLGIQGGEE